MKESRVKAAFKFFNVWATHKDFLQLVEEEWKHIYYPHKMRNFWAKQKALREKLRRLNEAEFKGITTRINQAREDLKEIQHNLRQHYSDEQATEEKKVICQLEQWSLIEESALQQKARAKWIKLEDANTSYFSAVIKDRKQRKQILKLDTQEGEKITDPNDIKLEIIQFYKSLIGTALQKLQQSIQ